MVSFWTGNNCDCRPDRARPGPKCDSFIATAAAAVSAAAAVVPKKALPVAVAAAAAAIT